ncbi:MAG: prephenate dehydratase [Nanopusillaceae archaeon]
MKIFYLGPRGSFSNEAAEVLDNIIKKKYEVYLEEKSNFYEIFRSIGKNSFGIVPIENNYSGSVREVYNLVTQNLDIKLSLGFDLPIELYLIGEENINARYVYSHQQAIEQARDYIIRKGLIPIPVSSTSEAVRKLVEEYRENIYDKYAIANKKAAQIYGMNIIEKIDIKNNFTRFLLIGKEKFDLDINGEYRTILIFELENKPGSLYKFLEYFYENNINLSKIESIPIKNGRWEYYFILEYEGDKSLIEKDKLKGKIIFMDDYKFIKI